VRGDRKQQRVRACSERAGLNGRARKHACVLLDRALKHQRARAGWAFGGERGREGRSPIFKFKSSQKNSAIAPPRGG
jgi:hypothetical protein